MERGELVTDAIVSALIGERLDAPAGKGAIFDGYPAHRGPGRGARHAARRARPQARPCDRARRSTRTRWSSGSPAASPAPIAARAITTRSSRPKVDGRLRRLRHRPSSSAAPTTMSRRCAPAWPNIAPRPRRSCPITKRAASSAASTAWRGRRGRGADRRNSGRRPPRSRHPCRKAGGSHEISRSQSRCIVASPAAARSGQRVINGFEVRETVNLVGLRRSRFRCLRPMFRAGGTRSIPTAASRCQSAASTCRPGGCFCERFAEWRRRSSICASPMSSRASASILTGALGPLLYEATTGVMDVKFKPSPAARS